MCGSCYGRASSRRAGPSSSSAAVLPCVAGAAMDTAAGGGRRWQRRRGAAEQLAAVAGERRPPPLAEPAAAQIRAPAALKPVPLRPSGVGRPDLGAAQDRVAYVPAAVPRLRTARGRRGRKPRYLMQERRAAYGVLVEEAEQLCAAHYEPSSQAVAESARRCFEFFIDEYKEERPDMFWGPADLGLSWRASLHNEISLMIWATWMVRIGLAPVHGVYVHVTGAYDD